MTENQKTWLLRMIEKEIEETEGTIDNEHLWALRSNNTTDQQCHINNIKELKDYIEILKRYKGEIL
jgi:hypothetical protein